MYWVRRAKTDNLPAICVVLNVEPIGLRVTQFHYTSELWLPRSIQEVFDFFSDASNLEAITPRWVKFSILTPCPIPMKTGTLIDYRLRIRGIPVRWQSEITVWQPPHRFVDEQRRGPYRLWIHEHVFQEENGGTRIRDLIRYSVLGGKWTNRLFVQRDIERIFACRRAKLLEIFGPSGIIALVALHSPEQM